MKSTGMVRRLDSLCRVVVPREILNARGLGAGSPMEVFVDGEDIVLRAYNPGCKLCGSMDKLHAAGGDIKLCTCCIRKIIAAIDKKKDAVSA